MASIFFFKSENTSSYRFKNLSQSKQDKFKEKHILVNHSETWKSKVESMSETQTKNFKKSLYYWDV